MVMIQQKQSPGQLAASSDFGNEFKHSDFLLDMSGLLFKPMPLSRSALPQEARFRDSVLVSMDTLPLASLPHLLSPPSNHPRASKTHALAPSTKQKSKTFSSLLGETTWYTLLAGVIIVIYLIVPLMMTLVPVLSDTWSRLLVALEILGIIEFIICRILIKTVLR
jgi:hypothetical protein